jgi:hypothetical protein
MSKKNKDPNVGWILVPPEIVFREDLTISEKYLFGRINGLKHRKGYCFASNKWLGEQIGLKANTVSSLITNLVKKKLLARKVIRNKDKKVIERRLYILPNSNKIPPLLKSDTPPLLKSKDSIRDISNRDNNISNKEKNGTSMRLYDFYVKCFDKNPNTYKPLPSKLKKIETRLKTYTPRQIAQAFKNASLDDFYSGRSEQWVGADLVWICKNDETLEKMLNLKPRKTNTVEEEYPVIK